MEQFKDKESVARRSQPIGRDCFPDRFDFFGHGSVHAINQSCGVADLMRCPFAVAFRVSGDESGLCIVAFDHRPLKEDERSLLTEVANVLVSKFANALSEALIGSVDISPPDEIDQGPGKHRYLSAALGAARLPEPLMRRYEYKAADASRTAIRVAFLPAAKRREVAS
jgi:hypothetical protein